MLSVCPTLLNEIAYHRNAIREFLEIWPKCSLGLKDETVTQELISLLGQNTLNTFY